MEKVHHVVCPYALKKLPQCASRAKTLPLNKRPLTARPKRLIISPGPLSTCCANCAKTLTPMVLNTRPSLPWAMAPSATKPPSVNLWIAPFSSRGLAKTCASVFPTGAQGLPAIPWKETKIFHGGRYRRIRYKEVSHLLWQRGGGRRLLRLFVLAPTPYRKTKTRRYYREEAYLLCDDNKLAAKALLQA